MADTYNMSIDQGSDYSVLLTCQDSSGEVIDLTGYTAHAQFRRSKASADVELDLTIESGLISITEAVSGEIEINLPNSVTENLSGIYYYDLELTSSGGEVTRLMQGVVKVDAEVTR